MTEIVIERHRVLNQLNNESVPEGYVTQREANEIAKGPQRNFLLVGGARSGKTALHVKNIFARALNAPGSRHLILRWHFKDAWTAVALETIPFVLKYFLPDIKYEINGSYHYFRIFHEDDNEEESQVWLGGLADKAAADNVLGRQYASILASECSQLVYPSITLVRTRLAQSIKMRNGEMMTQRMYYDLNPVGKLHWTNVEFGLHRSPIDNTPIPDPENYVRAFLHPVGNRKNLDDAFIKSLENLPVRQRARFYEGRYVDEAANALWTFALLEHCRISPADVPPLAYIVVAVDPSGAASASDDKHDAIGIIVAGRDNRGNAYILEDLTCLDSPKGWARKVIAAYRRYGASMIVAETNFGGAMVEAVIRAEDQSVQFKKLTASRGKTQRAEPVASLYGDPLDLTREPRVFHVGRFQALEEELVCFSDQGYAGERSPNRADACVIEGTLVETITGPVPIERIRIGDLVLTRKGYRRVTNWRQTNPAAEVMRVVTSLGWFEATLDHLVGTVRGWVRVDALVWDDMIVSCYSPLARSVGLSAVAQRKPVYDISVEGEHEFFANGHLVHNCVWAVSELLLGENASGWVEAAENTHKYATGEKERPEIPESVMKQGLKAVEDFLSPPRPEDIAVADHPMRMRSPLPRQSFVIMNEQQDDIDQEYVSDQDCVIESVLPAHIVRLAKQGCRVMA